MKNIVLILGMFLATNIQAQLLPPWPIPTSMVDQLNRNNYKQIKKDHQKMTELNTEHWLTVEAVTMAIIEKHDRLFIAGSPLIGMRAQIDNYILDARAYYNFKYPILTLMKPYPSFQNFAIQDRYRSKTETERQNIKYYLGEVKAGAGHELRIPEGERVLLTLQALSEIMQRTLENAEY